MLDRAFAVPAAQQVLGFARLRLLSGQHAEDVATAISGATTVALAVEDLDAVAGRQVDELGDAQLGGEIRDCRLARFAGDGEARDGGRALASEGQTDESNGVHVAFLAVHFG